MDISSCTPSSPGPLPVPAAAVPGLPDDEVEHPPLPLTAVPPTAVRQVLELARTRLGLDVDWLSRLDGEQATVTVDEDRPADVPAQGSSGALLESSCSRELDGCLPSVDPDAGAAPATSQLQAAGGQDTGDHVAGPGCDEAGGPDEVVTATRSGARSQLRDPDRDLLELLAGVLSELVDRTGGDLAPLRAHVRTAIGGTGRRVVLQPVVDVTRGREVGVEALSRFDAAPGRPDLWFAQAEAVGLRAELELAAVADALVLLREEPAPGWMSVNLSPLALLSGALPGLIAQARVDPTRVVVEVTEHAEVDDYDQLNASLAALRTAGLRVAVDDAGAGYASLRHIVRLAPDFIKLDVSLVRGLHEDARRQALVRLLQAFADETDAVLIAEGVETVAELEALMSHGITLAQGHLLAEPGRRRRPGRYLQRAAPSSPAGRRPGTSLEPADAPPRQPSRRRDPDEERAVRLYAEGRSAVHVAAVTGLRPEAVLAHVRARGGQVRNRAAHRLDPVQEQQLLAGLLAGASNAELARRFGISPPTVAAVLARLGLPPRPTGRPSAARSAAYLTTVRAALPALLPPYADEPQVVEARVDGRPAAPPYA